MTNRKSTDIIIVGGGIAGTSAAYWLSRAQVNITLFEPVGIGAHASGLAFGVLPPTTYAPDYGSEINCLARAEQIELSHSLPAESQIDYQFTSKIHAELAMSEARADELKQHLNSSPNPPAGETMHWRDLEDLRKDEPLISDSVVGALMLAGNFELDPLLLTQALWQVAADRGATQIEQTIDKVLFDGSTAIGVQTKGGEKHFADTVILANGAWVVQFADLKVAPLRGQILRVKSDAQPLKYVYFWGKNDYVSSKPNGLDYIGSTEELLDDLTPTPTAEARQKIMKSVAAPFPFLSESKIIQHTACLRPASPDGNPLVGKLQAFNNLAVIGGAGRNGILQSPLMGRMISDLLIHNKKHKLMEQLKPERFG